MLAARLRHARRSGHWRPILLGLIATIGEEVEPASPALDHPHRDLWERARIARLMRQLEAIRSREHPRH